MAAAELTEKISTLLTGLHQKVAKIKQITQNDWVIFPSKGIWQVSARLVTGAAATITRGVVVVNNKGTAYSASTTSIAYDGGTATRSAGSFYVESVSGEILEVIDSAPTAASGTLTVLKRGCFGTTASATGLVDDNTLYVMNNLVLGDNQTAAVTIAYTEMPDDVNINLFG